MFNSIKTPSSLVAVALLLVSGLSPAGADTVSKHTFVLTDLAKDISEGDWSVSGSDLGVKVAAPFTIKQRVLHGGRQEGVELIEVDNGRMRFSVIPTRGMSIHRVETGDVTLGWNSPVKEIVNPAFINLESRGGLGWLDGFNEFMVRCGFEWAGHPGMDNDRLLTLHGRTGNIPASTVVVSIDEAPPHRIRVRGRVVEQTFKFSDYEVWTEISTEPGSAEFRIQDVLTNHSSYEREYQVIYHGNFGPPLLEAGAKFVAPVQRVAPFDKYAAKDLDTWTTYLGPTKSYGEQVYNVVPYAGADGRTTVMLHNAAADRGVAIRYDTGTLPNLTLWKNTDTLEEGYVTGLEPGTGFPYPRVHERKAGRVPKLAPGASVRFDLEYSILLTADEVTAAAEEVRKTASNRPTETITVPER